jgi:WD40-like Beta Propeller Repeat
VCVTREQAPSRSVRRGQSAATTAALRDGRERREPSAAHAQPGDDGSPDWSPDGGRIAFSSNRNFPDGAGFEIYSIRPDSACLTWLTNGTPESTAPDWRPGAGASSDPGRCGDAARPALIETDVRDVARLEGSRPLWLGRSFRGLLLTGAERTRPGIFFRYDDCARYDPRECPEELYVSQASVMRAGFPPPVPDLQPRALLAAPGRSSSTSARRAESTPTRAGSRSI